jgi:branched-chain amino acid transport system substrate-binding protein
MYSWSRGLFPALVLLLAMLLCLPARAAEQAPILLALDAEFGHTTSTSAQAVQQGIEIAIDEINRAGGVLGGRKLQLVTSDNRSIPAIAVDNLRAHASNPNVVAVFGGKFSPTYMELLPAVHELGILLLDPWGSADGITDHRYQPSYTFRLSLKDAWAGPALLQFARDERKASKVGVLLPNTAWGRSNQAAIAQAAPGLKMNIVGQHWYNWGDASLLTQYRALREAGAQAIILVANETEGSLLVRELAALPANERLPIVSHWGVTGGDFVRMSGDALQAVDFSVIQTYSFIGNASPAAKRVLAALKQRYGVESAERVKSPVGIAHAYDLTHLLAKAITRAGSADRGKVRVAMEQLGPYDGLVQRYAKPFAADRHDALSPANIFMARYGADDLLKPLNRRNAH